MTLEQEKVERLKFLSRVVKKEIKHLNYSAHKLFESPFSLARARQLSVDEALAEQLEAFTSRFCRLQDTVADKLLPAWLNALGEKTTVAIDNLDKAEKIGVLPSVLTWLEIRQLRNQMIHEYIEDLTILVDALKFSYTHLYFIIAVAEAILGNLENREIIESGED